MGLLSVTPAALRIDKGGANMFVSKPWHDDLQFWWPAWKVYAGALVGLVVGIPFRICLHKQPGETPQQSQTRGMLAGMALGSLIALLLHVALRWTAHPATDLSLVLSRKR